MYIISLLFNVPEMLTAIFGTVFIFATESEGVWSSAFASIWWCMRILFVTFSPAFAAGMLADQAQTLKLVLHERLLQEKDWDQCNELRKFSNYIDIRPLRFTVCKVIPLNWNLAVIIVNMIVSYLIVMVQFSNLSFRNLSP
ncbi:unnamed protein product [Chilo suppressalis]|uniref:ABC transmembrane type-1 domain-containing protein n=1 Tax=Chilo suppressalis TaxID=168631 RepID=A0ABN8B7H0_CHISP|nr:unnamed protein product [Chilo suppressalis]